MQGHAMRIGLDLDNTLICYDQAFLRVGKEEGILSASFVGNKAAVKRALLVERPDGYLWEALQGLVYGRRIDAAMLFDGVTEFLEACRSHADTVAIVSHKTERAHYDPQTDLRVAALRWMESKQFFDASGLGPRAEQRLLRGHEGRQGEANTGAWLRRLCRRSCRSACARRNAGGLPQDSLRQRSAKWI